MIARPPQRNIQSYLCKLPIYYTGICPTDCLLIELLGMIRGHGDKFDLVFHVWFYLASRGARAFYDKNDEYGYHLCRMHGLGCLHDDPDNMEPYDWREVAFECEAHTQTCSNYYVPYFVLIDQDILKSHLQARSQSVLSCCAPSSRFYPAVYVEQQHQLRE
jgi:hypothetical protein